MKGQWGLIVGIIVVLVIAIFAVINVDTVEVNYMFGQAEWPLVLIIIGSVLMGGIIVGSVGMFKIHQQTKEIKKLEAKLQSAEISHNENTETVDDTENEKVVTGKRADRNKK